MSFAYMPLFTGDYLRDTRHLSPQRHGVYLLALMHCWDSKGPMPLDEQECAGICNCRSSDEIEALRYILARYFVKTQDGHYNKRMAEEVAKSERLSGAFREAGLKSAEARREKARAASAKVEPTFNQPSPKVEPRLVSPSPSPSPSPSKSQERVERFGKGVQGETAEASTPAPASRKRSAPAAPVTCPIDVSATAWADWIAHRKAKRATVTGTVIEQHREQAQQAGISLQQALAHCCSAGWQGFRADWYAKDQGQRQPAGRVQQGRPLADAGAEAARQAEETRKAKAMLFGGASVFGGQDDVIEGEVIR